MKPCSNSEVTRAIDVDVTDGQSVVLTLNLNAPARLTAVDPVTLSTNEQVFADLINVVAPQGAVPAGLSPRRVAGTARHPEDGHGLIVRCSWPINPDASWIDAHS